MNRETIGSSPNETEPTGSCVWEIADLYTNSAREKRGNMTHAQHILLFVVPDLLPREFCTSIVNISQRRSEGESEA